MPITPCPIPCAPCSPPLGGNGIAHLGLNPLDPNNPFVNLSAEELDADLFFGRKNPPPITGEPPLGDPWYAAGCLGFCISTVSQEDADLCAAAQAVLCVAPQWPQPNTPVNPDEPPVIVPREVFYNDTQFCSFTCPDGSLFTFTVAAGFFNAFNKATANAMALSFACQKAVANRLCPGNLSNSSGCLGVNFLATFSVATTHVPVSFSVVNGSLPPGVSFVQENSSAGGSQLVIGGTPNATGDYPFVLQMNDTIGGSIQKALVIHIYGIVTASELPDATINLAYSTMLVSSSNLGVSLTYTILGGALPDGLTLNSSTGEISGTPTVDGAYQINVRVSNGSVSCNKVFDLFVAESAACFDWTSFTWNPPVENAGSSSSITIAGLANTMTAAISADFGDPGAFANGSISSSAEVYDGVECNAICRFTFSGVTGQIQGSIDVVLDGNDILLQTIPAVADGVFDIPFVVTGPGVMQAFANFSAQNSGGLSSGNVTIELLPG